MLVSVLYPESFAQSLFYTLFQLVDVCSRDALQFQRVCLGAVAAENVAGKVDRGQNIVTIVFRLVHDECLSRCIQIPFSEIRSRVGHAHLFPSFGRENLQWGSVVEPAVENARKLYSRRRVVHGIVVQLERAVAHKYLLNLRQLGEIILYALDGGHHLTSIVLNHHLILDALGGNSNFGQCLNLFYCLGRRVETLSALGRYFYLRVECCELLGHQHLESVENRQRAHHGYRRKRNACNGHSRDYVYCLMALFREKVSLGYVE